MEPSPDAGGRLRQDLLALVLLLLACLSGCSPARTIEAAALLADIARQDVAGSVRRTSVTYQGEGETRRGDLYVPATPRPGSRAGLVLVPGAAEGAMDDPRLVDFADALRRRGFRVLVPELGGGDFLQVSAGDADAVADAARHLLDSDGPDRVGMAALSYAVGPTIRAALRPDIRQRVGFVVAIGGYHSVVAGITYLTTGAYRPGPDGPWRRADVDRGAGWRFLQANTGRVGDPEDARLLAAIARARLAEPEAETSALRDRLGPEGWAIYRVFANRDPDRVPALLAGLPPRIRDEIAALDLTALDLGRLAADLILIHGRDDPLVPHSESLALARAAGPGRAEVFLLRDLRHVDLAVPGPRDLVMLLGAAYRVLEERDEIAGRPAGG